MPALGCLDRIRSTIKNSFLCNCCALSTTTIIPIAPIATVIQPGVNIVVSPPSDFTIPNYGESRRMNSEDLNAALDELMAIDQEPINTIQIRPQYLEAPLRSLPCHPRR